MARRPAPRRTRPAAQRPQQRIVPISPPPGTYDPALDAAERASRRGLEDYRQDTDRGLERGATDYGLTRGDQKRQRKYANEDYKTSKQSLHRNRERGLQSITQSRERGLQSIMQSRQRAGQDRDTSMQDIRRNYQNLGEQQEAGAYNAGIFGGGALAQSLAKRTANQQLEQAPVQRSYKRFREDSSQQENYLNVDSSQQENYLNVDFKNDKDALKRSRDRARKGFASQAGQTGLTYQRSLEDSGTGLTRAEREGQYFSADTSEARFNQAKQAGWTPPQMSTPQNYGLVQPGAQAPSAQTTRPGAPASYTGRYRPSKKRRG
jgi:hypothetical protein